MKGIIKICIFGVLLILAGCRSEEDVLASHEIRERGSRKFATFISKDGKKVDYAEGFRYLALRYDSIHRKNHVGLNGGELETMGYKERKSVSHSYIEFSVRTELNIEENGDKWMMFPRVQSGQVVGLVAAALTDDGTYVSFIDIGRNNEVFRRYVGDFQEGIRGVENQTMGYIPPVWIIKRSKHPENNPIDNRDSGGGRGGVWDIIRGIGSSRGIDEGGGVGSDGGGNGGSIDGPCAAFGDCYLDFSNLPEDTPPTPCENTKDQIVNNENTRGYIEKIKTHANKRTGTEIGYKFNKDGSITDAPAISRNRLKVGDPNKLNGFYHNHTGQIDIFSPHDISSLIEMARFQPMGNKSNAFMGVIGYGDVHYIIRWNNNDQNSLPIFGSFTEAELEVLKDRQWSDFLATFEPGQPNLNREEMLEKIFYQTLDRMGHGIKDNIILQKVDKNNNISTVNLNSDGTTSSEPCN